jgi:outer membrane lipoprotein SlyB
MKRLVCIMLCVTLLGLPSACANLDTTQQGALIGGGAGAGLGGMVGALVDKGDRGRGALIGAAIGAATGALAGAMIGKYIETKEKNAAETATVNGYTADQGLVVKVHDVRMVPQDIRPGETSRLVINYALMNPDPKQVLTVTEKREVKSGTNLLREFTPSVKNRNAGTYTTEQEVTFPKDMPNAQYVMRGVVEAGGKMSSQESSFQVVRIPSDSGYRYLVYKR